MTLTSTLYSHKNERKHHQERSSCPHTVICAQTQPLTQSNMYVRTHTHSHGQHRPRARRRLPRPPASSQRPKRGRVTTHLLDSRANLSSWLVSFAGSVNADACSSPATLQRSGSTSKAGKCCVRDSMLTGARPGSDGKVPRIVLFRGELDSRSHRSVDYVCRCVDATDR